jgi:hypothetical protein
MRRHVAIATSALLAALAQGAFASAAAQEPPPPESISPAPTDDRASAAWFAPQRRWFAGGSFVGLYSSAGVPPALGGKVDLRVYVHERIQLLSDTYLLSVDDRAYPFGDFRIRFWGFDAEAWHPAGPYVEW